MSRIDIGHDITKPKTVPATVEGFNRAMTSNKTLRISTELKDLQEQVRRGELTENEYKDLKNKKKRYCSFYTPHAHFRKGYKRRDGDPVDSGKAVIDLDDCEIFNQLYEERLKGRERALGINLVNRSISGTGGHILFDIPDGLTRQQAQEWMAEKLGVVDFDRKVHEPERAIFIPCKDYILYLDEELMFSDDLHPTQLTDEELKKYGTVSKESQKKRKSLETPNDGVYTPLATREGAGVSPFPTSYHGIPFADIIRKYWEVNNRGFEPTRGDRDTLTYQLACDLRHICGKSFEWLDQVIPCYDGFPLEEKRAKIRSALSSQYENFPQRLRDTLNALEKRGDKGSDEGQQADFNFQASTPPEMPAQKPKLIELLTSNTPEQYKAAVANAVFPPLATHLCDVSFCYTDNKIHEATLMNCLMAETGAGKGCIDDPIRLIMADIKKRDEENEKREAEWKKDCQKKGANKDKKLRPVGLVIQIVDPDMTKPALVTRMNEAEGHFVYVKLNELDLFEQLKGQNGKQHFQLMCLAFDPGAEFGQTRFGTQSVTARPICRFNWNACTTLLKGRRFFRNVLTDGPISRINFCTIPKEEIGCDQPIYGIYDEAFNEALKPYIDNLVNAKGLIDCPQAYKLARQLQAECAEFARLSQNETYWNLSHRACVIAWLKACVLYVANGCKWEKSIGEFIRWSLNYDLWCKMAFFGNNIEKANRGEDSRLGTRGPRNLLELLPDEFTLEEAKQVRLKQGLAAGHAETTHMISSWKYRGYCSQITDHSFKKNHKFLAQQNL